MKFTGVLLPAADGRWKARHESPELGIVEVVAPTREEAAEKLRQEIRYRLELCPCSGESYQHIAIEIV